MIKNRKKPKAARVESELSRAMEIDSFVNGADQPRKEPLDKNAPRNYKKIALPFNKYEFEVLTKYAEMTNRSKSDFLRVSLLSMAARIETVQNT